MANANIKYLLVIINEKNYKLFKEGDSIVAFSSGKTSANNTDNIKEPNPPQNTPNETSGLKGKNENSVSPSDVEIYWGDFSFTNEERDEIRAISQRFFSAKRFSGKLVWDFFQSLSTIMDISKAEYYTKEQWEQLKEKTDNDNPELLNAALKKTISILEYESFSLWSKDIYKERIADASQVELIKAWVGFDFFALMFQPLNNFEHFRDYIHNVILEREKGAKGSFIPVECKGTSIYINSKQLIAWRNDNLLKKQYELDYCMPISEAEPTIYLYEDEAIIKKYKLQKNEDENFTGKNFILHMSITIKGNPEVFIAKINGFISDTEDIRNINLNDIGYSMENAILRCSGEAGSQLYKDVKGKGLVEKGLKNPSRITPGNIRLIGICPQCNNSFTFKSVACYMIQRDAAYSDDGMDCCEIPRDIDVNTWQYTEDGKTFRYYNNFNCPHCKTPYIDNKKHPQHKTFGVPACIHLGRKHYKYN
jgi:hypothetical protein